MPRYPVDSSDWKLIGSDRVSAIGLGTWAIRDPKAAEDVMVEAVESGLVNLIDTAEMYGNGSAEEVVGRVIRRVGRDRVFVTTKVLPYRFTDEYTVEKAVRASLARLGVREVDLVLVHWRNPKLSAGEQVRILEKAAYEKGLARYIGVSNYDTGELEEALTATRSAEVVVDQVHYSVLHKEPERTGLLDLAIREGVTIQAYTPLERGEVARHPTVRRVAEAAGRTPVQVALNYLISRPRVVAIPKTENRSHLHEILGSLGWRLPPELIEELEAI
ncbi:aldo/keto reductase [Stetteria hydrogenophila]